MPALKMEPGRGFAGEAEEGRLRRASPARQRQAAAGDLLAAPLSPAREAGSGRCELACRAAGDALPSPDAAAALAAAAAAAAGSPAARPPGPGRRAPVSGGAGAAATSPSRPPRARFCRAGSGKSRDGARCFPGAGGAPGPVGAAAPRTGAGRGTAGRGEPLWGKRSGVAPSGRSALGAVQKRPGRGAAPSSPPGKDGLPGPARGASGGEGRLLPSRAAAELPEMRAGRAKTARGERLSPEPARGSWERGFAADTRLRVVGARSAGRLRGRADGAGGAEAAALRAAGHFRPLLPPSFAGQPGIRRPPPWAGGRRSGGAAAAEERLAGGQQVPRCAAALPGGGQPCYLPLFCLV